MKIGRYPRISGLTFLMVEYHKSPNEDSLEKIKNFVINHWLLSNGVLCGKSFDPLQLSKFLKTPLQNIQIQMGNTLLSSKLWEKEHQEEILGSLIGTQLAWAMEDRMEINQQVNLLKASQKNKYAPFITSELNKALGLKLSSSTSLQNIVKSLSGSGSINIFNNIQQNNTNEYLTKEEAVEIIQEENQKLLDTKEKALAYIEVDPESLPEVVATKQQGSSVSKDNSQIDRNAIQEIIDNYQREDSRHDLRRAEQLEFELSE